MHRVLLVLPFNERSGACVSALNLKSLLESKGVTVSIASPEGDCFKQNITISKIGYNIFSSLFSAAVLWRCYFKYDTIIFFTIRTALISAFFSRSKKCFLYLHEVDVQPVFLSLLISRILIKRLIKNVIVVSPFMSKYYGESVLLLPNVVDTCRLSDNKDKCIIKDIDYIMIANFRKAKGVYKFRDLANSIPNKRFMLITNKVLADSNELDVYLDCIPLNMSVCFKQDEKNDFLRKSKYLVNLSELNETFGLTLVEAISVGVIPLCYYREGFAFCLGEKAYFLDEINTVESIVKISNQLDINVNYDSYLRQLIRHVDINFSPTAVMENARALFKFNF
ncbi:hypothetical protein ACWLP4_004054 [Vibrio vulnificus]